MTTEQFLEWINEEIEKALKASPGLDKNATLYCLKAVRDKFLTLTPPPTTLS